MQMFLSVWREFYRQKSSFIFSVLFPAAMVFLLGTLLEQWNVAEYEVPTLHIAYVSEQENPTFDQYLEELQGQNMLKLTKKVSLDEALKELGDTYCAVIENKSESNQIIIHQGTDKVANRTLHILFQSYASLEQAVWKAYENGVSITGTDINTGTDYVKTKKLGIERTMIDYYAVSMIVMILFMAGSIGAASSFHDFSKSGLESRVSVSSVSKIKVFVMMLLGNMPVALIEIASIMLCSVFFFGARYAMGLGANLVVILYFILLAMTINAFGAIVGMLFRTDPIIILLPLSWTLLFFGGSFSNNVDLGMLTRVMPTHIVQQAVFDLTLFGNYDRIISAGSFMLVILFAFCGIGALLFTRKRNA
ncbi:MAG TPA: ABC transporter permease [Lachnospiraceae bacterium]|nr:ABC transporter permease [Lachnospiraceae bacterium]